MLKVTKKLGDLLVESQLITKDQLAYVLQRQKVTGKKIGELLIEEGIIQEKQSKPNGHLTNGNQHSVKCSMNSVAI